MKKYSIKSPEALEKSSFLTHSLILADARKIILLVC